MKKKVIKTLCVQGIKKNHRSYTEKRGLNIIAGDTETYKGNAWTIQLYNGEDLLFQYVNNDNILDIFIKYIEKHCKVKEQNIVYFHNLEYDLMILFRKFIEKIYRDGTYCEINYKGWFFEIYTGKVNYIIMKKPVCKKNSILVYIYDAMAFTQMGLDRSLTAFGINAKKIRTPEGLGVKKLKTKEFEEYAKNDVKVLYLLAKKIIEMHKVFDITPSVSIAQFSMKVFRHDYLREQDKIMFPPEKCVELSERSYHGGKNFYLYNEPRLFENAIEIDINSSYPYACLFLPSMIKGRYVETKKYTDKYVGVYEISGKIKSKYPILFDDEFKPIQNEFKNICATIWDIKGALEYADEFDFKVHSGYIFIDESDYNPFEHFVLDIYEKRKQVREQKDLNLIYKYILNSFYGKFIQTNENDKYFYLDKLNEDEKNELDKIINQTQKDIHYYYDTKLKQFVVKEKKYEAGLYYNPFIATLITSFARYNLLRLEYKYNSFHSATDSIKTISKIDKKELSNELGGCKIEVEGKCFVFRNKLYLHFAKDFSNCNHKPDEVKYWDDGQHLSKYALHGYIGTLDTLVKNRYNLLEKREMEYNYTKVVKLREGFKRGLPVADFLNFKEKLILRGLDE